MLEGEPKPWQSSQHDQKERLCLTEVASEVVVISLEESRRRRGELTGEALIAAMQASPARDIDLAPERPPLPVRDVTL